MEVTREMLTVKPLPWHTAVPQIEAMVYCGERGGQGGTFMVRLKDDPQVYFTGGSFDFADKVRIGQGNRMNAKKSAWCRLAKVTRKALDTAIKVERQRREDNKETEEIERLRHNADFYGFKLVPL